MTKNKAVLGKMLMNNVENTKDLSSTLAEVVNNYSLMATIDNFDAIVLLSESVKRIDVLTQSLMKERSEILSILKEEALAEAKKLKDEEVKNQLLAEINNYNAQVINDASSASSRTEMSERLGDLIVIKPKANVDKISKLDNIANIDEITNLRTPYKRGSTIDQQRTAEEAINILSSLDDTPFSPNGFCEILKTVGLLEENDTVSPSMRFFNLYENTILKNRLEKVGFGMYRVKQ